jgi:hypothetical protein
MMMFASIAWHGFPRNYAEPNDGRGSKAVTRLLARRGEERKE